MAQVDRLKAFGGTAHVTTQYFGHVSRLMVTTQVDKLQPSA